MTFPWILPTFPAWNVRQWLVRIIVLAAVQCMVAAGMLASPAMAVLLKVPSELCSEEIKTASETLHSAQRSVRRAFYTCAHFRYPTSLFGVNIYCSHLCRTSKYIFSYSPSLAAHLIGSGIRILC
jgi:hypothetical protein